MKEELKIIILEDVQYDVELIEYELRREGINFTSKQVEIEENFIEGLNLFKPDVILADHSLPKFDGVSALEIAKKIAPEVPFIFVSGKIGDEFAVDMLKKGATDYVFKNNLTKLVPAVKRALTERDELTELKKSKSELQIALQEKEMLLKEIHHRVKNNLIMISNLLELQSHYIKDKTDFNFFRESQNRANSMALIHERFYQSADLKSIDFGEYICTLATDLVSTYVTASGQINLITDVENIFLDIDTAIPLGLILNELLTNSLKYAFPVTYGCRSADGTSASQSCIISESVSKIPTITVVFHKIGDKFELIVKDNGIGFPKDLDYKKTGTLGLELINRITKQIDGIIEMDASEGSEFKITFKELEI
ncbi:histidine kinase dimerization/phosphoacceptor domain -containing protein [Methanobacterium sp.]|jgi:two-component sensor histidine kinase/CheY-like chemotaxis protein|uniref:histidine kinase dimerization/phosphoacceptor domain -containing protein n=1 Tax=Methanobacterium sp. TaxID=2164 RepID=UPI003158C716